MTKIHSLLSSSSPTISFEFFPPKDELGVNRFNQCLHEVNTTNPDFVSVTYGAAGSDQSRTREVVIGLQSAEPYPTMAHLTCIGHTRSEINEIVDEYTANGVRNILALGGDIPKNAMAARGEFDYASDLVDQLRERYDLSIGVAAQPEGHPRSLTLERDRQALANKLEVADFGVTQFFFDNDHYFSMMDDLRRMGCEKPVIPGVIAITSVGQVKRFAELAGATIPEELATRIEAASADRDEVRRIGIEQAIEQSRDLLDGGAPGIHFYCLNRPGPSMAVLSELDLPGR